MSEAASGAPAQPRAIVVGATGALGTAITRRLLADGFAVLAVARRRSALEELAAAHDGVWTCPADIAADDAVGAIDSALGDGPVRMVVHCAAAPPGGPILNCDPAVLGAAFAVKVGGLVRLVRAAGPRLVTGSRVIAIGGSLGLDPTPDASTAGVANAAQANLVRQLNRALASAGVTCHSVAPGPVATERFTRLAEQEAARRGVPVRDVLAEAAAASPLGRLTTRDEVAWAVALLAADEAAALAGSTLLLDAGRRTAIP